MCSSDLLDLLLGNNGSLPTSNGMLLLRAVGAGFVDETALRVPNLATVGTIVVLDYDGDGWSDVNCSDPWGRPMQTLKNTNGVLGTLPNPWSVFPGYLPLRPAAADLDRDGDQDLVTTFGVLRNRVRDLQDAAPPRLGCAAELVAHAYAGDGQNAQVVALLLADSLGVPMVIPGLGTLFLDPASLRIPAVRTISAAGSEASLAYSVPAQPALLGTTVFAQALFLHTPASSSWRLSGYVPIEVRL